MTPKRMLLALVNSSLAFFLASYQVHEKSILLSLFPLAFLLPHSPLYITFTQLLGCFTMFPLLKRDKLVWPYIALNVLYAVVVFNGVHFDAVCEEHDEKMRSGQQEQKHSTDTKSTSTASTTSPSLYARQQANQNMIKNTVIALGSVGMITLHILEFYIPAPVRYPDLYPALFAMFGALNLLLTYVGCLYWQWSLKGEEMLEQGIANTTQGAVSDWIIPGDVVHKTSEMVFVKLPVLDLVLGIASKEYTSIVASGTKVTSANKNSITSLQLIALSTAEQGTEEHTQYNNLIDIVTSSRCWALCVEGVYILCHPELQNEESDKATAARRGSKSHARRVNLSSFAPLESEVVDDSELCSRLVVNRTTHDVPRVVSVTFVSSISIAAASSSSSPSPRKSHSKKNSTQGAPEVDSSATSSCEHVLSSLEGNMCEEVAQVMEHILETVTNRAGQIVPSADGVAMDVEDVHAMVHTPAVNNSETVGEKVSRLSVTPKPPVVFANCTAGQTVCLRLSALFTLRAQKQLDDTKAQLISGTSLLATVVRVFYDCVVLRFHVIGSYIWLTNPQCIDYFVGHHMEANCIAPDSLRSMRDSEDKTSAEHVKYCTIVEVVGKSLKIVEDLAGKAAMTDTQKKLRNMDLNGDVYWRLMSLFSNSQTVMKSDAKKWMLSTWTVIVTLIGKHSDCAIVHCPVVDMYFRLSNANVDRALFSAKRHRIAANERVLSTEDLTALQSAAVDSEEHSQFACLLELMTKSNTRLCKENAQNYTVQAPSRYMAVKAEIVTQARNDAEPPPLVTTDGKYSHPEDIVGEEGVADDSQLMSRVLVVKGVNNQVLRVIFERTAVVTPTSSSGSGGQPPIEIQTDSTVNEPDSDKHDCTALLDVGDGKATAGNSPEEALSDTHISENSAESLVSEGMKPLDEETVGIESDHVPSELVLPPISSNDVPVTDLMVVVEQQNVDEEPLKMETDNAIASKVLTAEKETLPFKVGQLVIVRCSTLFNTGRATVPFFLDEAHQKLVDETFLFATVACVADDCFLLRVQVLGLYIWMPCKKREFYSPWISIPGDFKWNKWLSHCIPVDTLQCMRDSDVQTDEFREYHMLSNLIWRSRRHVTDSEMTDIQRRLILFSVNEEVYFRISALYGDLSMGRMSVRDCNLLRYTLVVARIVSKHSDCVIVHCPVFDLHFKVPMVSQNRAVHLFHVNTYKATEHERILTPADLDVMKASEADSAPRIEFAALDGLLNMSHKRMTEAAAQSYPLKPQNKTIVAPLSSPRSFVRNVKDVHVPDHRASSEGKTAAQHAVDKLVVNQAVNLRVKALVKDKVLVDQSQADNELVRSVKVPAIIVSKHTDCVIVHVPVFDLHFRMSIARAGANLFALNGYRAAPDERLISSAELETMRVAPADSVHNAEFQTLLKFLGQSTRVLSRDTALNYVAPPEDSRLGNSIRPVVYAISVSSTAIGHTVTEIARFSDFQVEQTLLMRLKLMFNKGAITEEFLDRELLRDTSVLVKVTEKMGAFVVVHSPPYGLSFHFHCDAFQDHLFVPDRCSAMLQQTALSDETVEVLKQSEAGSPGRLKYLKLHSSLISCQKCTSSLSWLQRVQREKEMSERRLLADQLVAERKERKAEETERRLMAAEHRLTTQYNYRVTSIAKFATYSAIPRAPVVAIASATSSSSSGLKPSSTVTAVAAPQARFQANIVPLPKPAASVSAVTAVKVPLKFESLQLQQKVVVRLRDLFSKQSEMSAADRELMNKSYLLMAVTDKCDEYVIVRSEVMDVSFLFKAGNQCRDAVFVPSQCSAKVMSFLISDDMLRALPRGKSKMLRTLLMTSVKCTASDKVTRFIAQSNKKSKTASNSQSMWQPITLQHTVSYTNSSSSSAPLDPMDALALEMANDCSDDEEEEEEEGEEENEGVLSLEKSMFEQEEKVVGMDALLPSVGTDTVQTSQTMSDIGDTIETTDHGSTKRKRSDTVEQFIDSKVSAICDILSGSGGEGSASNSNSDGAVTSGSSPVSTNSTPRTSPASAVTVGGPAQKKKTKTSPLKAISGETSTASNSITESPPITSKTTSPITVTEPPPKKVKPSPSLVPVQPGDVVYVDLRTWGEEWYKTLTLPKKHNVTYVVKCVYGELTSDMKHIKAHYPVLAETYTLSASDVRKYGMQSELFGGGRKLVTEEMVEMYKLKGGR
eukprot:gene22763-28924_t